jgi:L-arabinose isomerase
MSKLKIGLLPMYIKLYDDMWPEMRKETDNFINAIADLFLQRGVSVIKGDTCRVRSEFEKSVEIFEKEKADAIVTLHLAYSPSLESAEVLAKTKLPIVVLDTTPAFDFSHKQHSSEIFFNHGIHGVQDMCNLLLRLGKPFLIEAGHYIESDVIDRAVSDLKASKISSKIRSQRVGRVGDPFVSMGDFDIPEDQLKRLIGMETIRFDPKANFDIINSLTDNEIQEEITKDRQRFITDGLDDAAHRRTVISGLILRKWIEKESLTAVTVNFMEIDKKSGFPCMPFLEASKGMSRGIGYAGEGDVLTAALTGSLMSVYDDVSFTEMFCPDWKNNSIFLSHMGEMNLNLAAEKPFLEETEFLFSDADTPVIARGRFKEGAVIYINIAPTLDNELTLILAKGYMLGIEGEDNMKHTIHGWFKPAMPVPDFLEAFSNLGGTHHSALVYSSNIDELIKFGKLMDWKTIRIC